jgi:hypothetical protein
LRQKLLHHGKVTQFIENFIEINVSQKPDFRPTIYWNANIKTDKDGKAIVKFFNSDICKNLIITIEGTDGMGKIGAFRDLLIK